MTQSTTTKPLTLVTCATGKTGRRVAARLEAAGWPVRRGSRAATPAFDWERPETWSAALAGVDQVYIAFQPDLAVPGATDAIAAFVDQALAAGTTRVVLLSGRGEPGAQACEAIVLGAGIEATVVRASWFAQNFDEGPFAPMIQAGTVPFLAGTAPEPFLDIEDLADVAFAALTEPGHAGEIYEVTGPRLLRMAEAVGAIADAAARPIAYVEVSPEAYRAGLIEAAVPAPLAEFLVELVSTTLDGRNAYVTDGVERALGRPPRDFAAYVAAATAADAWGSR